MVARMAGGAGRGPSAWVPAHPDDPARAAGNSRGRARPFAVGGRRPASPIKEDQLTKHAASSPPALQGRGRPPRRLAAVSLSLVASLALAATLTGVSPGLAATAAADARSVAPPTTTPSADRVTTARAVLGCPLGHDARGGAVAPDAAACTPITIRPFPTNTNPPRAECTASISHTRTDGDNPEFGGRFHRIGMRAEISCTGGVSIAGRGVELIDRTPGQDPASTGCYDAGYEGCVLGTPDQIEGQPRDFAVSEGHVDLYDVDYPKGQQVEIVFGVSLLLTTNGWVWRSDCNVSGLRVIRCRPAENHTNPNTWMAWGAGTFSSGVVRPCDTYDHTLRVLSNTAPGGPLVDLADVSTHVKWCWNSQEVTEVTTTGGTNWTNVRAKTTVAVSGPDGPGRAGLTDPVSGEPAGQFRVSVALSYEFVFGPITYKGTCTVTIDGWYYTAKGQHYFRDYDGCSDRHLQTIE
jgi:hypothetical protein